MAKFYVGQRVRVKFWRRVLPGNSPALGEGRVIDIGPWNFGDFHQRTGRYFVDQADCVLEMDSGAIAAPMFYQLEPILDQKHEACDEDFKRDLDRLLERQGVSA